jgi:hypothetical protein
LPEATALGVDKETVRQGHQHALLHQVPGQAGSVGAPGGKVSGSVDPAWFKRRKGRHVVSIFPKKRYNCEANHASYTGDCHGGVPCLLPPERVNDRETA